MAVVCLPKEQVDDILSRIASGEINPEKLISMTSKERHTYFTGILGDKKGTKVNAILESKLILKNQQQGIISWAKQITGMKPEVKRDMLSKVEKMTEILTPENEDAFLQDLASQRLGVDVTVDEAARIAELSKGVSEKKSLITEDMPIGSSERIEYGTALTVFKDYVSELKTEAAKPTLTELLTSPTKLINEIGGATKSILASLDNSFFGRQGFITLINETDIWVNNFKKSWGDIGKELKGVDAMTPIKADIFSRPNALNGKYKAMKLDIGLESEEAFPSALPARIPLFGRLYKASESAYNGAALRFRADLADRYIAEAESMGVDVMDKEANIGTMTNFLTGRGKVHLTPQQSKIINVAIFSIKYVKSNIDALTAPVRALGTVGQKITDPGVYAKRKAAYSMLKVIGVLASVLTVAKMLDPESVEEDPRSSNFGKILVGKNHDIKINISMGMNSLVTLASRITPTLHNGEWGFWKKNAKGEYTRMGTGKYGVTEPSELIFDYMKGKSAPILRVLLDYWEGRTFSGEEPTIINEMTGLATPIPIENMWELAQTQEGADPILFSILSALDLIGFGVNVAPKRQGSYPKRPTTTRGNNTKRSTTPERTGPPRRTQQQSSYRDIDNNPMVPDANSPSGWRYV